MRYFVKFIRLPARLGSVGLPAGRGLAADHGTPEHGLQYGTSVTEPIQAGTFGKKDDDPAEERDHRASSHSMTSSARTTLSAAYGLGDEGAAAIAG